MHYTPYPHDLTACAVRAGDSDRRGRQAGSSGDLAPMTTRPSESWASALAWLPDPAGRTLAEDGASRIVHRFLLMGTSTGEISVLRVKEVSTCGQHMQQQPSLAPSPEYEDVDAAKRADSGSRSTRATAPRAQAVGVE